jgi:hypothetical protein
VIHPILPLHESDVAESAAETLHSVADSTAKPLQSVADFATAGAALIETS